MGFADISTLDSIAQKVGRGLAEMRKGADEMDIPHGGMGPLKTIEI